ncbi:hypothetical protein D2V93_00040 [Flagellimonas taeanensis]|uniref:coiled-coil domain-containing protein n=1 Tax=Flavobacteriaceae TaxID=49546 RepID=UPI000E677539|nr:MULTISPECIES: hypothetical protein [Allomuricauda]MDC6384261.1 hypothetical protein [Muricauda sp. SK9]RIV49801.1 hypothetical protein D2V93_12535 [Allomuricauda taeanensis]RIV53987.1 hypothetical protein D2V93_00040 [Allomuricauda taeanensis]
MKTITFYLATLVFLLVSHQILGQEDYEKEIKALKIERERIVEQEKEALKVEVKDINRRLERGDISEAEAKVLKEEVAKRRAMNIEERVAIVDNRISLLERNEGQVLTLSELDTLDNDRTHIGIMIDGKPAIWFNSNRWKKDIKYDRRTYSDFVMAIGLNNALIEGQSLDDSPYKIGGSRFFEMGWQWRTRVFENSNWLRLNYGFSFQFNGLKPKDNQIFVKNGDQTVLEEFEYDLDKSKLRMDNLVFPVHFEFGPSRFRKTERTIRYSIRDQFRVGLGGYGGFNLGTRQKLKYSRDGEDVKDKLKRDYNTSDLIYGVSGYMGFDGVLLYVKYDLNPIFQDADIKQNNISLGLRFDI